MVTAMKMLLMIAYIVFLLALGSYCLFFPRSVQAWASKTVTMGVTAKISALKAFIESDSYLVTVRAVGLVAWMGALLLAVGIYSGGAR